MKNELSKKKMKESMKLTWKRQGHPSIGKKRPDTTLRNITDNPARRPGAAERIRQKNLANYHAHPETLLNARLRRNKITKLELTMLRLLHELGLKEDVDFIYNDYIKTRKSYRFPDFRFLNRKAIIETDGTYWHQEQETERDAELEELGYFVKHYSEKELFEDYDNTKEEIACLLGLKQ